MVSLTASDQSKPPMRSTLYRIARRLVPSIDALPASDRHAAAGYVIRAALFLIPALAGFGWLIAWTEPRILIDNAAFLAVLFAFMVPLSQLWLELHYFTVTGGYRSDRRSFWGEALWAGVLVIGPAALWLGVILAWVIVAGQVWRRGPVGRLRLFSTAMFRTALLIPMLIEVVLYRALGGKFPMPGLDTVSVFAAAAATLLGFSVGSLMIGGNTWLNRIMQPPSDTHLRDGGTSPRVFARMTVLIGPLVGLVAIFPAGLYSLAGAGAFFAFLTLLLGAALLADRLSRTAERARQRTREIARLEQLAQSILQSPSDGSALPDLLREHVPGMFPLCGFALRLNDEPLLIANPRDWAVSRDLWDWQPDLTTPHAFPASEPRPWQGEPDHGGVLIVPVLRADGHEAIGRMVLHRDHGGDLRRLLPAAQSLAAQIASSLYSAEAYRQTLEERVARERAAAELALGARVQSSFLPKDIPRLEGWQIAATLEPARETSGDFYDLIPLRGGKLGIVVADVADKGLGAAFYMALGVTLFRTFAVDHASRYPRSAARRMVDVIHRVNKRYLRDTNEESFITAFFGILDPRAGTLSYVNAGHNPPYLFRRDRRRRVRALMPTGPALGIADYLPYKRKTITFEPDDLLVLYTDGLVEAEDPRREPFEVERLHHCVRDNLHAPVDALCDSILASVYDFCGGMPRFDDITLMLIRRDTAAPDSPLRRFRHSHHMPPPLT